MRFDHRRPAVRAGYGLGVLLCLALAVWGVSYWVPRLGAAGWLWVAFMAAMALYDAWIALGTPGWRSGPNDRSGS